MRRPLRHHGGSKKSETLLADLSDVPENLPLPAPGSESPQALNYSQIASAAVAVSQGAQDPSVSSTETLLRNIQGLLKVAADNARQQERQINYEKGQWRSFLKALERPFSTISLSSSSPRTALRGISPCPVDETHTTRPSFPLSFSLYLSASMFLASRTRSSLPSGSVSCLLRLSCSCRAETAIRRMETVMSCGPRETWTPEKLVGLIHAKVNIGKFLLFLVRKITLSRHT